MHSNLLLALGLLAAPAWAGGKCVKGNARSDPCGWAARACPAECSSFQRTTVTPCPSTVTKTSTSTVTKAPVTATVTNAVTNTNTVTTPVTVVSVTTIEDTATLTFSTEIDVTNTVVVTTTVAVSLTSAPLQKRGGYTPPLPVVPHLSGAVEARYPQPTTCRPTTSYATKVPSRASACRSSAAFASACSCAGVTSRATTLPAKTSTVTKTVTTYVTPTVTATAVQTSLVSVTVPTTVVVPSTFETTDATTILTAANTVTAVVTSVAAVTTTVLPSCTVYNFVDAGSDTYAGQFLNGAQPDPTTVNYGYLSFVSDATQASRFTLRPDGRVYGGGQYGWVTEDQDLYYALQMTDSSQAVYSVPSLICSITTGTTGIQGAVGLLTCSVNGKALTFGSCSSTSNNLLVMEGAVQSGCTALSLAAIPIALGSCAS